MSTEIYKFILENRIHDVDKMVELFKKNCIHDNQSVQMLDGDITFVGNFKGITPRGEAIVETNDATKIFISGSLILN